MYFCTIHDCMRVMQFTVIIFSEQPASSKICVTSEALTNVSCKSWKSFLLQLLVNLFVLDKRTTTGLSFLTSFPLTTTTTTKDLIKYITCTHVLVDIKWIQHQWYIVTSWCLSYKYWYTIWKSGLGYKTTTKYLLLIS